jgi:hypothetical protein
MPDRSRSRPEPSRRVLALACCLGLLAAGGFAQAQRGLIQRGEAPDLFLLYTGDVIGYLGPCG